MNKFALLLPFAFATQFVFAQSSIPTGLDAERNLADIGSNKTGTMIRTYDSRYEGVKGTPFFVEEWGKATITSGDKIYHNVDLKYDAYNNQVLYRNNDGKEFVVQPHKVDSFVLRNSKTKQEYHFTHLPELAAHDAKLTNQFFVLLYDGDKTKLVMMPEKTMVKANYKGGYSAGRKYDELVDAQTFYFVDAAKKVSKVRLNKRNLLKALPDKQDEVQEYVSSMNIDLTTEEGWAKSLAYYESL